MEERFTVRVYDSKKIQKITALHQEVKSAYPTLNKFLVYCIDRGLESIERDIGGFKTVQNLDELYDEIKKTFARLNDLIKFSERNTRELIANSTVNRKLLSCNYNMLLGISEKNPKTKSMIESGMYDNVPKRLEDYLEDLLNVFLTQNGK